MKEREIIKCAFCTGRGTNPFYRGTCPVCKGKGKNEVIAPFVDCRECKGNGKKSGTTLTCFECRGMGVVPDAREDIEKARSEIREIQKEMAEEQSELYGKINKRIKVKMETRLPASPNRGEPARQGRKKRQQPKEKSDEVDKIFAGREASAGKYFCQSCAQEVHHGSTYKVCEKCFFLYKFGEVREIKPEEEEKENPPPLKLRRARENEE